MFRKTSASASDQRQSSSFSLSPEHIKVNTEDAGSRLGQGGFGVVFKGTYRLAPAAIKQLLVQDDLPPEKLAEFFQEADIMATLHHPHIIQLYGYTESKPYRIIMEFMPKGSLYRVLHNKREDLDWTQRITWGIEIGAGLHYLHTCQPVIIHRDLKSLNVLISKDNQAKLTDFGLALSNLRSTTKTVTATSKKSEGTVGSLRWMAPELFSFKPKYSQASDIFAFAIVLWEIAAREIPYAEVSADSVIQGGIMQGEREEISPKWPRVLSTLIQACWDQTPSQRPIAEKAVEALQEALSDTQVNAASGALSKVDIKPVVVSKGYAMESQAPAAASHGYAFASETPTKKSSEAPKPAAPTVASPPLKQEKTADSSLSREEFLRQRREALEQAERLKQQAPAASPPKTTTVATAFFQVPAGKQAVNQADVEKLLLHVARGEQDQAEAMLKVKSNESLLLHKGKVTDYSDRTFKSISAFQYALWALDWHMWKMLRKYLSNEDAATQLQDLESHGTEHDKHYDFTPLIQALKTYVDNYDPWTIEQCNNHWIKVVGGAQTKVPAHVANEYCRPDRSFDPKPSFTEDTLPRTFDIYEDNKFFPLSRYSWGSLSVRFGIYRGGRGIERTARAAGVVGVDLNAISGLCEIRTVQYQALTRELTAQLDARPRPR